MAEQFLLELREIGGVGGGQTHAVTLLTHIGVGIVQGHLDICVRKYDQMCVRMHVYMYE